MYWVQAQTDFLNVKNWLEHKLLTVNLEKTYYLPISCNNVCRSDFDHLEMITLRNRSMSILPVDKIKYLGVMIDSSLKWDVHIRYVIKKLQSILYKFRYLNKILTFKHMKILYFALVESHLRSAW